MIALTYVALVSASFSFSGGPTHEFVKQLGQSLQEGIVCASNPSLIAPLKAEEEDRSSLLKTIASKLRQEALPGTPTIFALSTVPDGFLSEASEWRIDWEPAIQFDGSKVLVREQNRYRLVPDSKNHLKLGYLEALRFSKPLKIHWFARLVSVTEQTEPMDEKTLLRALAWAACGKLVDMSDSFEIQLDPERFRRFYSGWALQVANRCRDLSRHTYAEHLQWLMTAYAVAACSDDEIKKMMKSPDGWLFKAVIPGATLDRAMRLYIAEMLRSSTPEGKPTPIQTLFQRVDRRIPAKVWLKPKVPASVFFRYPDGGALSF